MHLKEIRMENFKTFRKKVTIPIFEGFTGITGPNGSGKSNVADAILFVLGPRSSKMVRAKRLSDLIFHGNDRFKPSKECKVTLVFDNSDRMIPVDRDEVSLKRIIRISQTDPDSTLSYFYVNGKSSSQSEFENILTHAHLSAEGYNIVLQGHIAEFVNKTPLKIREEIDDIAGIRKYDEEVRIALKKKENTEENMEKIQWHLDFIKGRLRELRKEKEEAEKYREAQEKINQSKALYYTVQKQAVDGELSSYNMAIDNAEKKKIDLRAEIERLESERARAERESKEVEQQIADITGEEGKRLKVKLDEARLELMRAKDVIETAEDSINELNKETSIRRGEIKDISRKISALEKEKESTGKEIEKVQEDIATVKKERSDLEKELERSDADLLNLRRDLGKVVKELESKRDLNAEKVLERDRTKTALEMKINTVTDLEQMVSTLDYEIKDLSEQIVEMDRLSSQEKVKNLQKQFMEARQEERYLGKRMRELESEITSLNRLYTQMKVEFETSEKLSKGVSMAVDNILTARDTGEIKGIHGTIGELGDVPEDYSTALEVAAGGRISAIVVDDDEVAATCIDRLKRKKLGRATFLPLNKVSTRRPGAKALMVRDDPHVIGLAVDLIDFDQQYSAAFSWAFGDTVVVDRLDSLRRLMGGVRIVTLEGEIAGSGGDITGGSLQGKRSSGSGFGKRSRSELDSISAKLKEKMAESESLTGALNEIREKVNELESNIRKITGDQVDTEGRKRKMSEIVSSSREQLKEKEESLSTSRKEIKTLENRVLELDGEIRELEEKIKKLTDERDELQENLDRSTPKAVRDRIKALRGSVEELDSIKVELIRTRDGAKTQITIFSERSSELKKRIEEIAEAVTRAEKEKKEATAKEERFRTEVKALEKVLSSIDAKTKGLYEKLNSLGREIERVLGKRDKARMDGQSQDQIIITQRTNIRIAEEKMADILREMQIYRNVKLPEPPWPSERDLARTVRELEAILENVGNVNLKALEEYEEMEVKKEEVSKEMKALEKEKKELEKLIEEIDQKRKSEFLHVYEGIDRNFREIYKLVSGGGEAYFELDFPDDPLNGGLNIHVKPPGKKMTRLGALSGGEKSLTSMAFIFSVQAWDPSPFYLLDEVDQNLDAVNAEIIAKMINQNSKFAQFVIISLRKISLKEAHHLYGVTIQNGESVILGKVDLKEVEKYEKGANTDRGRIPEESEAA
jgi:chromosome segregation protein